MVGISQGFLDILKFQFYSNECVWSRGGLWASVCSSVFLGGYQWLALSLWNIYQPVLCLNDHVRIPCLVMKPRHGEGGKKWKMDCWESEGEMMKKMTQAIQKGKTEQSTEKGRDDRASHSSVNSITLCHPLFSTLNLCQNIAYLSPGTHTHACTHTRAHTNTHLFPLSPPFLFMFL